MLVNNEKCVLIKGKAGLGNRLLSAATGLLYGRITKRKVYIDWSDETYSNQGENAFPAFFQVNGICSDPMEFSAKSVAPLVWDGHLTDSASVRVEAGSCGKHGSRVLQQYSIDIRKKDYSEELLVLCRYTHGMRSLRRFFEGEFAELKRLSAEKVLSCLFAEFVCSEPIKTRVDAFAGQHFNGPTIGVHIRHMDRSCGLQPFLRRVDALRKRMPQGTVFLATDDAELNKMFQERYGACMTNKWYPSSGNSLHQNRECPDRQANGIEALTDLYLLSKCDYLVYPRSSTFSWVASLLSTNPAAQFLDVERYHPAARFKHWIRDWLYT